MAKRRTEGNGSDGKDRTKQRAEQILAAAEELLSELGYDGISARDIAERAGVNKALVFYYWGSMDELFEKILERYYTRHRDALAEALKEKGPLDLRVHRVIDAYLDFIDQNNLYPRLVQQQICGSGQHLELVQRHLRTFFQWMTRALADITPAQGPLSAKHFYISISGIVISYFTYTPVLGSTWGQDPLSDKALTERRAHVHWLVDALLARLQADTNAGEGRT